MCSGLSNPCHHETEECFEGESLGNYVCRCKEGFKITNNGICEGRLNSRLSFLYFICLLDYKSAIRYMFFIIFCLTEESKLEDTPIIMYIVAVCVLIILILAMIIIIICLIG